jgi:carbamoyltransferase
MKDHINRNIKFREDFRPFAPAVLQSKVHEYFERGNDSPYMILVDKTREECIEKLCNVTHCDGSARVQTIEESWNLLFHKLVTAFESLSGIAVVLNTSLNRKGMPIVETPSEALELFSETALDILVIENTVFEKQP